MRNLSSTEEAWLTYAFQTGRYVSTESSNGVYLRPGTNV
jgi:hypothetical protein